MPSKRRGRGRGRGRGSALPNGSTGASTDVDNSMSAARGEAAGILRTWGTDPHFPIARSLNIWKRLVRLDGTELVNGAMSVLFYAAPELEKPVTLRIFYAASTTPLYEQCKARWLESQHTPSDSAVPNVTLRRVPDARDGYRRDRAKKLEQYQQLTKAIMGDDAV